MKNLIFSFLFLLCSMFTATLFAQKTFVNNIATSAATSQNEMKSRYEQEAIFLKKTFWGSRYVKNGVEYKLGFRAKALAKEFVDFPEAKVEFDTYRKNTRIGSVSGFAGLGVALIGLVQYIKRAKKNPVPEDVVPNITETGTYIGGFGLAMISGGVGAISGDNHLQKAIFLRNKALCN